MIKCACRISITQGIFILVKSIINNLLRGLVVTRTRSEAKNGDHGNAITDPRSNALPPGVSVDSRTQDDGGTSHMLAVEATITYIPTMLGKPEGKTLTIDVTIYCTNVLSLADSGANINMISMYTLAKLKHEIFLHPLVVQQAGIGNKKFMKFQASVSLPVSRQGLEIRYGLNSMFHRRINHFQSSLELRQ